MNLLPEVGERARLADMVLKTCTITEPFKHLVESARRDLIPPEFGDHPGCPLVSPDGDGCLVAQRASDDLETLILLELAAPQRLGRKEEVEIQAPVRRRPIDASPQLDLVRVPVRSCASRE